MTRIDFKRPDGQSCPAYLAEPGAGRGNGQSVVVVYEMWGLAPAIRGVADRLAEAGYRALIPDLFRGRRAHDLGAGFELMGSLDFADAANQDVAGAASWLKESGGKVAVAGFCMGGAIAVLSALSAPALDAAVCFYGIPPLEAADPAGIRIPISCHFAAHDDWCTPERVDALEGRLRAGNVPHELFRYDASHAFMNPDGRGYDAAAAEVGWTRMLAFLDRTLR